MIEASTDTSGISIPPSPIERMKGRGRITMLTRPIATVDPETITPLPAPASLVSTMASSTSLPAAISSLNLKIINNE